MVECGITSVKKQGNWSREGANIFKSEWSQTYTLDDGRMCSFASPENIWKRFKSPEQLWPGEIIQSAAWVETKCRQTWLTKISVSIIFRRCAKFPQISPAWSLPVSGVGVRRHAENRSDVVICKPDSDCQMNSAVYAHVKQFAPATEICYLALLT